MAACATAGERFSRRKAFLTKTEPVAVFSGLAAVVGLGLHWLLPDATIPDEVVVGVVFGIALIARRYVSPCANMPDAEVLEHARRAVRESGRKAPRPGPGSAVLLLALLAPSWADAQTLREYSDPGYDWSVKWVHPGGADVTSSEIGDSAWVVAPNTAEIGTASDSLTLCVECGEYVGVVAVTGSAVILGERHTATASTTCGTPEEPTPTPAIPAAGVVAAAAAVLFAGLSRIRRRGRIRDAAAERAARLRRRGLSALLACAALSPAAAAASEALHCEEWPHWAKAYDNIYNYDHRGGEAVEWLQLAGCPPVWSEPSQRWLPNGSDCDAPCEMAEERVRVALTPEEDEPALEATIVGGCAPECTTEPADVPAAADHRREPLTFTVRLDTRRDVDVVEDAAPDSAGRGAGETGCSCTLQVPSGGTGQCYAPRGVTPDEWTHTTSLGDAQAVWLSPRRAEGQFRAQGRGQMLMSFLLDGERVQCETVRVTKTSWQRFVGVVTDPRVLVSGGACVLGAVFGGVLCGF